MNWVNLVLGALGKLLAPFLAYTKGRTDAVNDTLKEQNKRLANRPRTNGGVADRLRAWKRKN